MHIAIMVSLLADLDFMRRAAEKTNGFYFYLAFLLAVYFVQYPSFKIVVPP